MKRWMAFLCGAALVWTFNMNVCSAAEAISTDQAAKAGAKTNSVKKQSANQLNTQVQPSKSTKIKGKTGYNYLNPQPEPPKPSNIKGKKGSNYLNPQPEPPNPSLKQ
jgi:hypothetical protein